MEGADFTNKCKALPEEVDLTEFEPSDNEATEPKTRKKRKRQGVRMTRKAATIALVGHNRNQSPFLRLPPEARDEIIIELIGDHFIHVQAYESYDHAEKKARLSDITKDCTYDEEIALAKVRSEYLTHSICRATNTERQVYEAATCNVGPASEHKVPGKPTKPMKFCQDFGLRHRCCELVWPTKHTRLDHLSHTRRIEDINRLKELRRQGQLDLTVLRVCRQLYEEGTNLLWKCNTFFFNDQTSLGNFMKSLNPSQKRKLEKIHFSSCLRPLFESDETYRWAQVIKLNLRMLQGIKAIDLTLDLTIAEEKVHGRDPSTTCFSTRWYLMRNIDHFLSFRNLSPQTAKLMIAGLKQNSSKARISFYQQISAEVEGKLLDKDKERTLREEAATMEVYYRHLDSERDQRDLEDLKGKTTRAYRNQLTYAENALGDAERDRRLSHILYRTSQIEKTKLQITKALFACRSFEDTKEERLDEYAELRKMGDNTVKGKKPILRKYIALGKGAAGVEFPRPRRR